MLILAFDTATGTATAALVRDGALLGERSAGSRDLLDAVDALLGEAGAAPGDLDGIACGVGPGSFTGVRIGLAHARGLALALDVPVAGVSTLAALAHGAEEVGLAGAIALVDARRGEVFALVGGEERCLPPADLAFAAGTVLVGDGAVRYRELLEERGGVVPPDGSPVHVPLARWHARLAGPFGAVDTVLPAYLRAPDAKKAADRAAGTGQPGRTA